MSRVWNLSYVEEERKMAEGASVPPLGLSNKAVYAGVEATEDLLKNDLSSDSYFIPQHLTGLSPFWTTLYDLFTLCF